MKITNNKTIATQSTPLLTQPFITTKTIILSNAANSFLNSLIASKEFATFYEVKIKDL